MEKQNTLFDVKLRKKVITQSDLEKAWNMKTLMENAEKQYKEIKAGLLEKLNKGYKIENGSFTCKHVIQHVHDVSWKEEFIRIAGEKAAVLVHDKAPISLREYPKIDYKGPING